MPHLRRQAIISHHGDDAMPGEHPSHRRVDTEVILVAEHPGAAVDEENDRTFLRSLGRIDIELLPSLVGIRAVVIGDVRRDLDFVERRGGLVLMGAAGKVCFPPAFSVRPRRAAECNRRPMQREPPVPGSSRGRSDSVSSRIPRRDGKSPNPSLRSNHDTVNTSPDGPEFQPEMV